MSEPTRYRIADNRVQRLYGGNCLVIDPKGFLVEWSDYARLKAEVERLRASSFVTAVPVEEYEKLKADVERLRKAGDDMAFHYQELIRIEWGNMTTHIAPSIVRWNAAKEGKQP